MRFDWYSATVRDDSVRVPALVEVLSLDLAASAVDDGPGRFGYASETILRGDAGDVLARVWHGGRQLWPSVHGSGSSAPGVAASLRAHWTHKVTRCDSAQDYDGEDAWERIYPVALALADERHLRVSQAGDWHRGIDGRTLYIGSRKSPVFARIYEKGKQLGVSSTWVRVELQVRPNRDTGLRVAQMEPEEVWGLSIWARELLGRLEGVDVPRVVMRTGSQGDDGRALGTLIHQYGAVISRLRGRLGSDEAVGLYLMEAIAQSA